MNYIYDILLNFKEELYDFYDWNGCDNIIHIRKIPIFKIDTDDLFNIKNNVIELDKNFLEIIKNRTEIFTSKNIRNIEYACLLSDGYYVMGLLFQDKKIKRSNLLIDEEMEALDVTLRMDITDLDYKIIKSLDVNNYKTRKQIEIDKYIKKQIIKISKEDEKLKYIYYECFNELENNKKKILDKLLNQDDNKINEKIYNFFKLTQVHK